MISNALIPRSSGAHRAPVDPDTPSRAMTGPLYLGQHIDWHAPRSDAAMMDWALRVSRELNHHPVVVTQ